MKGKIVLVPFPFTDLTSRKLRPALVLYEGKSDVVVAFISSKIPSKPSRLEVVIDRENKKFSDTGLKVSSVIRLDKVATVLKTMIIGEIGSVGPELRNEINSRITELYKI